MHRLTPFRDEAIPLLQYSGRLSVAAEARQMLENIRGNLAIVTAIGKPAGGKTYLLGRMLLNKKQGFPLGTNNNPVVWRLWGKPILGQTSKQQTINILVLDTVEPVPQHLRELLLKAQILLSSICLLNIPAYANQQAELQKLSKIQKDIDSQTDLLVINRDTNEQIEPLTRESLRVLINSPLQYRQSFNLTKPLTKTDVTLLSTLDVQHLSHEFVDQIIQLRRKTLNLATPKLINGKQLDGKIWIEMLHIMCQQINNDKLSIGTAWDTVCKQECQSSCNDAIEVYKQRYRELTISTRNLTEQTLRSSHKQAKIAAIQWLEKKQTNNPSLMSTIEMLKQNLKIQLSKLQEENANQNLESTKDFLNFQFQTIERKLRTREIRTFVDLRRQFTLFHEFYKKKGNSSATAKQCYHEFTIRKAHECYNILLTYLIEESDEKSKMLSQASRRLETELKESKQQILRQRSNLQNKIDRLTQQLGDVEAREQALQETLHEIKIQKEQQERSTLADITRDKYEQNQHLHDLRQKIMQLQNRLEDSDRQKLLLQSQILKKQALHTKSHENLESIIEDLKQQIVDLNHVRMVEAQKAENQKKQIEHKFQAKIKQLNSFNKQLTNRLSSLQQLNSTLSVKLSQTQQHSEMQEMQQKQRVQSLQTMKRELELQCRIYEQKINENRQKAEKLLKQQEELRVLSDEVRRLTDELKAQKAEKHKMQAVWQQKQNFSAIQLEQEKQRYLQLNAKLNEVQENRDMLYSELQNLRDRQSQEVLTMKTYKDAQKLQIDRLKQQQTALSKKLAEKEQQMSSYLSAYRERQENLEASKAAMLQQMRNSDVQRVRIHKISQLRNTQEVQKLNTEIEKLKQTYEEQLQELKNSSDESLRQLKNFHSLEKERLEQRILEEKARAQKKSQMGQNETIRKLRQTSLQHQEELQQLRRQRWDDEKKYKAEINRLEYLLAESKKPEEKPKAQADDNQQIRLQLNLRDLKLQSLAEECANKNKELISALAHKERLQGLLLVKDETIKLAREAADTEIQQLKRLHNETSLKLTLSEQKACHLDSQLTSLQQQNTVQVASLQAQNKYLLERVQENNRSKPEKSERQIRREAAKDFRERLIQAERELDMMQQLHQKMKGELREMEHGHTREISKIMEQKREIESRSIRNRIRSPIKF